MATRRIATAEKTLIDRDDVNSGAKSDITPAVPSSVIVKLLTFTFAMVTLPIGSYFATVNVLFGGNSTYAGALAAIMANVVLMGYIIVAFNDDKSEREAENEKKAR
ncbi:probable Vacuolar ATPase assembly integral membrane protein VMA21 [Ramularia collo-cygni]|uniref:Probable Vacuolar ATPase assembly integral membrane protein VMA21 n=1 Tax=Ramularia collo-cygni TaxID=112498 RepID=A0A2D3UZ75_9PEZI|nr:probable Vacuolar ATPase assembly integral membrane protein VMA21 [Ramularia collo-cygni]CZT17687.1 probable Vacuolar ATPase assembly integral membrane protein VMA21 [Ramularia collo-cygni]